MGCAVPVEVLPVPRRPAGSWRGRPVRERFIDQSAVLPPGHPATVAPLDGSRRGSPAIQWPAAWTCPRRRDRPPCECRLPGCRGDRVESRLLRSMLPPGRGRGQAWRTLAETARRAIVAGIGKASRRPGSRPAWRGGRQSRRRAGNPCRFIRRAVHHGDHRQDRREAWPGVRRGNRGTSAPKTGG